MWPWPAADRRLPALYSHKGASGNVASEDVVYLLDGLGIDSGVDLDSLAATGTWTTRTINRPNRSKAGVALATR